MYEKKLTSYPRTDCTVIGNPEFAYLKAYLADYLRLLDISIKEPQLTANKRYVDSSKVQEHYAIIPTRTTLKDWKTLSKKVKQKRAVYLYSNSKKDCFNI